MTFNIGSQSGGVVNNVAGDQYVTGGQHGVVVTTDQARRAVRELRGALAVTRLDAATAAEAHASVEDIDEAVRSQQPDQSRVARSLERLTRLLAAAGSFSTGGAALIGPLRTLAGWLGSLGEPILRLLG